MTIIKQQLSAWLQQDCEISSVTGDASGRQYYRVTIKATDYILMVATTDPQFYTFMWLAKLWRARGLNVPAVINYRIFNQQAWMLITDFGDNLYLNELNADNADKLYQAAFATIIQLQTTSPASDQQLMPQMVPHYLAHQLNWFQQWYLHDHLHINTKINFDFLIDNIIKMPYGLTHIDFHSRNLLCVKNNSPAIIDFQDAMMAPVVYDFVSLIKDCYISWPEEKITLWTKHFHALLSNNNTISDISIDEFTMWVDLVGLQRHLKVLGQFANFHHNGNSNYMQYVPRILSYVSQICDKYIELKDLKGIFL